MLKRIIAFVLLCSILFSARQVAALGPSYDGLDIVFLVDQSESMARLKGGGIPNDPLGLRFYSLWYAMYWMGEDHLLVHDKTSFRMAIVNFGSSAEAWKFNDNPDMPHWQEINPASRDAWNPLYKELTDTTQKDIQGNFSSHDLGTTNFQEAFFEAEKVFTELPEPVGQRLRVIIVLTDGQPYVEGPFSPEQHFKDLLTYTNRYFSQPNYRIYTVGMIDLDAKNSYWSNSEPYWEKITNDPCKSLACPDPSRDRAKSVGSNDEVGKRFQEILQDLTGEFPKPPGVVVVDQGVDPGPLVVPPYLKSITFTYFKVNPVEQLIITDPQGTVNLTRPDVKIDGADGPIQVIQIANPLPGEWQVATDPSSSNVDITMRQIFAQSRLENPAGPQVQFLPLTVRYALLDDVGQPLATYADPRYHLNVTATVNAGTESWELKLNDEPNNVYEAEFTPILTGVHSISVIAKSQNLKGDDVVVFDGVIGTFEVSPAVLAPIDLPAVWSQYDEKPLTFELQDSRGFPVKVPTPLEITMTVRGEDGAPVVLASLPDGTYQAKYKPQKSGLHVIHLSATILDSSGKAQTILDKDVGNINVTATKLVRFKLVEPASIESQQLNTELWPFNVTPLIVAVQLVDVDGNSFDPAEIFVGDPDTALSIQVKGPKDVPSFGLKQTSETSLYRAQTTEIGEGEYDISVSGSQLQPGYIFESPDLKLHVTRIRHPLQFPILIALSLLLAIIIIVVIFIIVRDRRARQHPCVGLLYIVDAYGAPRFQNRLGIYNKVVFTSRDINPVTHIRKMVVSCASEQESKDGQIYVSIWLDNDNSPILYQHSLRRNGEVKIGRFEFWLLKDPTEEQLSRDRSTGNE